MKRKTLVDTILDTLTSIPNVPEQDKTYLQDTAQRIRKGYYTSSADTYRGMGTVGSICYYFDINCPKDPVHLNGALESMLKNAVHNAWKAASETTKKPAGIDVKIKKDDTSYKITIVSDTSQSAEDIQKYKARMTKYDCIDITTIRERQRDRLSVKITMPYKNTPAPQPGQKTRITRTNRNQPPAPMP